MVESNRLKKLARDHMAKHPGTRYQQALEAVRDPASVTSRFGDLIGSGLTAEQRGAVWKTSAGETGLCAPLGTDVEAGEDVWVDFLETWSHIAVVGATGCGTSNTMRTIVAGLAARYSPQRVSMVLIDFKGPDTFRGLKDLPHVTAYAENPAACDEMARITEQEIFRREELLAAANAADIAAYRKMSADATIPDIIVVASSWQHGHSPRFDHMIDRVIRFGRALGVHLLLSTQRVPDVWPPRDFFGFRVVMHVLGSDSRRLVGSDAAERLPVGEALLVTDGDKPKRIRVFYAGQETISPLLSQLPADGSPRYRIAGVDRETGGPSPLSAFDGPLCFDELKLVAAEIIASQKVAAEMRSRGAPVNSRIPWLAFSGPPGTGKTSAMSALASSLHLSGLIRSSKTPGVSFWDAEGYSADNFRRAVTEAKRIGGLMFVEGLPVDFSGFRDAMRELAADEDSRRLPVVLIASRDDEIDRLLDAVPELRMRVKHRVRFQRFDGETLWRMISHIAETENRTIDSASHEKFVATVDELCAASAHPQGLTVMDMLGNGRFASSVYDRACDIRCGRLAGIADDDLARIPDEELFHISSVDFDAAVRDVVQWCQTAEPS